MLLFIDTWKPKHEGCIVSIHLMLLFIECRRTMGQRLEPFQYISCYSLSWTAEASTNGKVVSIHLMLLFIKHDQEDMYAETYVSIHLMLLFIKCKQLKTLILHVSIHLMLLFIGRYHSQDIQWREFQYISCYSLSHCISHVLCRIFVSIHLMLLFILS